ncbi:hypothetical protein CRYUN_Cryun05aG0001500 [Craigia yunnanensis]
MKLVENHFKFQWIGNEVDALHFVKPSSNSRRQHIAYKCLLIGMIYHRGTSTSEFLVNFMQFLLLVASTACFAHIMKIQVLAEREQKIKTEVKEIHSVFYCELCNKQYKWAMEFEVYLSSYDHNHRKRFKEMREMHGSCCCDDRQKREQRRQEREMAKFAQMYPIYCAFVISMQQQQQLCEESDPGTASAPITDTALADPDQQKALKFGFSSKSSTSKNAFGSSTKKPKVAVGSVFGNDSDDE